MKPKKPWDSVYPKPAKIIFKHHVFIRDEGTIKFKEFRKWCMETFGKNHSIYCYRSYDNEELFLDFQLERQPPPTTIFNNSSGFNKTYYMILDSWFYPYSTVYMLSVKRKSDLVLVKTMWG